VSPNQPVQPKKNASSNTPIVVSKKLIISAFKNKNNISLHSVNSVNSLIMSKCNNTQTRNKVPTDEMSPMKTSSTNHEADILYDPYSSSASNITTSNSLNNMKYLTTNSAQCTSTSTNHDVLDLTSMSSSTISPFLQHKDSNREIKEIINIKKVKNEKENLTIKFLKDSMQTIDKIKFDCDQANIRNNIIPIQIKLSEENLKLKKKPSKPTEMNTKVNKSEVTFECKNSSEKRLNNYSGLFKVIQTTLMEIKNLVIASSPSKKQESKIINL